MIHVVNIKTWKPSDGPDRSIYIGRRMPGREGSPLGNPFKLRYEFERAEVLARYEVWLQEQLRASEAVQREMDLLVYLARDEDLALLCWCAPRVCHGDVIKRIVEERLSAARRAVSATPLPTADPQGE